MALRITKPSISCSNLQVLQIIKKLVKQSYIRTLALVSEIMTSKTMRIQGSQHWVIRLLRPISLLSNFKETHAYTRHQWVPWIAKSKENSLKFTTSKLRKITLNLRALALTIMICSSILNHLIKVHSNQTIPQILTWLLNSEQSTAKSIQINRLTLRTWTLCIW